MTGPEVIEAMMTRAAGHEGRTVVSRLLSVMVPEAALLWLEGSEPLFGGARPIDVLTIDGLARFLRPWTLSNGEDSPNRR
jgi:hypothetical protein